MCEYFTVTACSCVCVAVCTTSVSLFPSSWADAATNLNHIAASFDQEAAAVVMARMAVARYAITCTNLDLYSCCLLLGQ